MTDDQIIPFDTRATTFSLNNAYWLARAAHIAYSDGDTIKSAVAPLGLNEFKFLSNRDTEGFVAANDDLIIVAFRGTQATHIQDLMSDARIHKVRAPFGKAHRGFLGAFELVSDDMFSAIDSMINKQNPQSIWFTGHSLGAALASLAVTHMLVAGLPVDGIYNFGQPRVGNREYASEFNSRIGNRHFRFVNNNDAVTRVPSRSLGYSHTGELRYIDHKGKLHDDAGMWTRFLDRVGGRMEDFMKPGTDGLKDHSMDRYVANIQRLI